MYMIQIRTVSVLIIIKILLFKIFIKYVFQYFIRILQVKDFDIILLHC